MIVVFQLMDVLGAQSGLMDDGTKLALLGVWMALFVVFAGRKFSQPIKVVLFYRVLHSNLTLILEKNLRQMTIKDSLIICKRVH